MDSFSSVKDFVLPIAKHEAGHWVAWRSFGGVVKDIEIEIESVKGRHYGAAVLNLDRQIQTISEALKYTRQRIITLYAGLYAEACDGKSFDSEMIGKKGRSGGGAYSDFCKAEELLHFHFNMKAGSESWEDTVFRLDQDAATLVINHYQQIMAIANHITSKAGSFGQMIKVTSEQLNAIYESAV